MAEYQGIYICGETRGGQVTPMTRELISAGRKLADQSGEPLAALLVDPSPEQAAASLIAHGVDRVFALEGPAFGEGVSDQHTAILAAACRQLNPSVLLFSHMDTGRDVAPALAMRLDGTVTTDCTDVSFDARSEVLLQSKPVYGGNAIAVWASDAGRLRVATLRPRSFSAAQPDPARAGQMTRLAVSAEGVTTRAVLIETDNEQVRGMKLEDATVVIAGGGGVGSVEGFALLEELAAVLNGAIGVSRVPCDEGWAPLSLEIGQTGHYVSPDLYVAVGISGAPQHMVGCMGSKVLVAVNRDPDANIFREADFGVVGDLREVLPSFIRRCKALRE
jgi:electron transfer flavoprotein alpha subunit